VARASHSSNHDRANGNPRSDVHERDVIGESANRLPDDAWMRERRSRVPSVAVLLPCRNEAATIGKVVRDFRSAIPHATVYVYDNASTDGTAEIARAAGAIVQYESVPGKGRVLRQMFAHVEAAVYVVADGDDTYDAAAAPAMITMLVDRALDMVIGTRVAPSSAAGAYRRGHRLGNWFISKSVHWIFGSGSTDMLSGYRVLSRRYVKSFPALSTGFETETEMTVHALELALPYGEFETAYAERPPNSTSKLRTIPDGLRIMKSILLLCRDYRPLRFFGLIAAVALGAVVVLVARGDGHLAGGSPSSWLLLGLVGVSGLSLLAGVMLDSLRRNSREMKRVAYTSIHPTHPPMPDRRESGPRIRHSADLHSFPSTMQPSVDLETSM
jgi:hypothetical protein